MLRYVFVCVCEGGGPERLHLWLVMYTAAKNQTLSYPGCSGCVCTSVWPAGTHRLTYARDRKHVINTTEHTHPLNLAHCHFVCYYNHIHTHTHPCTSIDPTHAITHMNLGILKSLFRYIHKTSGLRPHQSKPTSARHQCFKSTGFKK